MVLTSGGGNYRGIRKMETTMLRQSMFLILGLMAALTLGCEKKEEAPATPDADAAETAVEEGADAAEDAADAVEDAVDDAADAVEEAAKDIKVPGQ